MSWVKSNEYFVFFEQYALCPEKVPYDQFCDMAEKYARFFKDQKLSTSQIRNIYSLIMQATDARSLKILRPRFAYTSGKSNEVGVKHLMELLDTLVKKIPEENGQEQVNNLKDFTEALVAYMKYVGVKE